MFQGSTIGRFKQSLVQDQTQTGITATRDNLICIILACKDEISDDIVCRNLRDLSTKINNDLQPIFTSSESNREKTISSEPTMCSLWI